MTRAHGVRGDLSCEVVTDFPQRFRKTPEVFVFQAGGVRRYAVERARVPRTADGRQVLLKLEGIETPEAASVLRGRDILVPETAAWKLPAGQYYWHQLVGLRVVTEAGESLGLVGEVLATGANDVYVVSNDGTELLIPAIKQCVKRVDLEAGQMVVELLPGMAPTSPGRGSGALPKT